MAYEQKTIWCIDTNWGYGWETESTYDHDDYENPKKAAQEDAKEYRRAGCRARVVKRRERLA